MKTYTLEQSSWAHFLFNNTKMTAVWFLVRVYVGWIWLSAGWEKLQNPMWGNGTALSGFMQGALAKTTGAHPDVQMWYANFIQHVVLPHIGLWSYMVVAGELLIGLGLIFGAFVGVTAFFATFMSYNFMLAGSVSINPFLVLFGILLILARRIAGRWGIDQYLMPRLMRYCKR